MLPKENEKAGAVPIPIDDVLEAVIDERVKESNSALDPAVPVISNISEPADSTLIPSQKFIAAPAGTPISTLLTSIQQGFLFTPCSPLSPPQSYLPLTADDDAEVESPTPSIAHPKEAKEIKHQLSQDGDYAGKRIQNLISALEAKTQSVGDGVERQVLNDVGINK